MQGGAGGGSLVLSYVLVYFLFFHICIILLKNLTKYNTRKNRSSGKIGYCFKEKLCRYICRQPFLDVFEKITKHSSNTSYCFFNCFQPDWTIFNVLRDVKYNTDVKK